MSALVSIDPGEFRRIAYKLGTKARTIIEDSVDKATKQAKEVAKAGHFNDVTGNLRSSIFQRLEGWSGAWYYGVVISPARYSGFVEFDTKAHDIWPKAAHGMTGPVRSGQSRRASGNGPHEYIVGRGIALRWKDGSGEHFSRHVHHPGTKGKQFMKQATFYAGIRLMTEMRQEFAALEAH